MIAAHSSHTGISVNPIADVSLRSEALTQAGITIRIFPKAWMRWMASCFALPLATCAMLTTLPVPPADRQPIYAEAEHRDTARKGHGLLPVSEPFAAAEVPLHEARERNLAAPFQPLGLDRPAPFGMASENPDYGRALDCLASAMLYEAGADREGQSAVAQVVLNRLRHPAFPHSICAVVYQGSERTSGCQFTFTCDGALHRIPSAEAWQRARTLAAKFLAGQTDPAVGMATHYHTDWVYPYWSDTLDKIAKVGPHLFFRWRGTWGRKTAFHKRYSGQEPIQSRLAFLSMAHRPDTVPVLAPVEPGNGLLATADSRMLHARDGDHFIVVDGSRIALQGVGECLGQTYCKVVGWDKRFPDHGSPQAPVLRTVVFLYVSDKRTGVEIVLWDCARFNRPSDTQCLSDKNRRWITFEGNLSRAS